MVKTIEQRSVKKVPSLTTQKAVREWIEDEFEDIISNPKVTVVFHNRFMECEAVFHYAGYSFFASLLFIDSGSFKVKFARRRLRKVTDKLVPEIWGYLTNWFDIVTKKEKAK